MKSLGLVIQFQFTIEQIPRSPWLDLFVYLSISLCLAPVYEVWCIGIVYVNATLLGLSYFGESELYHSLFVWILSFIIILVNLNVSKILEIFRVVLFKNVSEENCLKRPIQWHNFLFLHISCMHHGVLCWEAFLCENLPRKVQESWKLPPWRSSAVRPSKAPFPTWVGQFSAPLRLLVVKKQNARSGALPAEWPFA